MKFPKKLYVAIGDGGNGPDYFNPSVDVVDLVEVGEEKKVAVYALVEVADVKGVAVTNFKKSQERK